MLRTIALLSCILLECSVLVSSALVVSQPEENTVWTPGKTYSINIHDDHKDLVQSWQVDLMVLGAECENICLHDGVVAEISKEYNTQSLLQFTVPSNLVQHGKGFQVQFSNKGSPPIYHSAIFTTKKATSKRSIKGISEIIPTELEVEDDRTHQPLKKRDLPSPISTRKSENAAPFVLPTVLATTMVLVFSCVFALFLS